MTRVLVTGGTGVLGSRVVRELAALGAWSAWVREHGRAVDPYTARSGGC